VLPVREIRRFISRGRRRCGNTKSAAAAADLLLSKDPEHREAQLRMLASTNLASSVQLSKEFFMPLRRRFPHVTIVRRLGSSWIATSVSVVVVAGLVAAAAPAAPAKSQFRAPSPAAVRYWKAHVVGWVRRDAWWRGYLSGSVRLGKCGYDRTGGLPTYGCRIVGSIDGTTLAFGGFGRIASRCAYGWTMAPPISPTHQLTRTFRYCG
jgi:hypothetical protein